jgi:hypothetical protein
MSLYSTTRDVSTGLPARATPDMTVTVSSAHKATLLKTSTHGHDTWASKNLTLEDSKHHLDTRVVSDKRKSVILETNLGNNLLLPGNKLDPLNKIHGQPNRFVEGRGHNGGLMLLDRR